MSRTININGKEMTLKQIDDLRTTCSLNCCFGAIGDCTCGDCKCCLPPIILSWKDKSD